MGFNDHFENRGKYFRHSNKYHMNDVYPYRRYEERYSGRMPGKEHYAVYIIDKIWNNRKLRLLFILSILILVTVIIGALFVLIPFFIRILDSVTQTGLKSVVEEVTAFITRLWNGSGN